MQAARSDLTRLYIALAAADATYWQQRAALRIYALAGLEHALDTIAGWTGGES